MRTSAVALVFGALLALTGCAEQSPSCQLTIGWDPWEPYQYQDVGGSVKGLDIELVEAMAERADCGLMYAENDWAALLNRIREGAVDVILGATKTEDRDSYAHFSEPYRSESFGLYVRSGEAGNYSEKTLRDLLDKSFKIGVTNQYIYGDEVVTLQDDPNYSSKFHAVSVGEANFEGLRNFEIDGFLEDPFVAAAVIRRKGLHRDIEAHPIVIETGEVQLMFSRASVSDDVINRFNAALVELKQDGTYEELMQKYRN